MTDRLCNLACGVVFGLLTVEYFGHLEEHESFPLYFLLQKASIEYASPVRECPSLCLQFE